MAKLSDPRGDYNPYAPPTTVADEARPALDDDEPVLLLAERGTRWWARLVDNVLLAVTGVPGIFMVDTGTRRSADASAWLLMLVIPTLFLCYQWYLIATTGQSIAKKWMRIKIVRIDGSPVGFVNGVLLRSWAPFAMQLIPYVGSFIGLADAVMIFGNDRRCMHDHIAGTKVVLALRGV